MFICRRITQTEVNRAKVEELLDFGISPKEIINSGRFSSCLVYKVQKMKEWGLTGVGGQRGLAVKLGAGRPSKRTPELLRIVEAMYEADPTVTYVQESYLIQQ